MLSSLNKGYKAIVRRFWWGAKEGSSHYLALKNWGSLCKPKAFRKFKDFNVALLAKLGWKLAKEEDCLWNRILRAKYIKKQILFWMQV